MSCSVEVVLTSTSSTAFCGTTGREGIVKPRLVQHLDYIGSSGLVQHVSREASQHLHTSWQGRSPCAQHGCKIYQRIELSHLRTPPSDSIPEHPAHHTLVISTPPDVSGSPLAFGTYHLAFFFGFADDAQPVATLCASGSRSIRCNDIETDDI